MTWTHFGRNFASNGTEPRIPEVTIVQALMSAGMPGEKVSALRKRVDLSAPEAMKHLARLKRKGIAQQDDNRRWSLCDGWEDRVSLKRAAPSDGPDPDQAKVIQSEVVSKVLVEAGPGNGKTWVLQQRVAALLANDTPPDTILVLSFTRVAVQEARRRIQALSSKSLASAVNIRTLDSLAGRYVHHLSTSSIRPGSHEQTIAAAVELVAEVDTNDALKAELARLQHVLIDEAQDLIGVRAALALNLLQSLPESCGWTVFHDPHQAIYGWDQDENIESQDTLPDLIKGAKFKPARVRLRRFYRSAEPELILKLQSARKELDRGGEKVDGSLREILQGEEPNRYANVLLEEEVTHSDSFVLFRSRGNVYATSYRLTKADTPHRIRMGGMPRVVAPWIALVANRFFTEEDELTMDRDQFEETWEELADDWPEATADWTMEDAWRGLLRLQRKRYAKTVDLGHVASAIESGRGIDELFRREPGGSGPLLGTIHGVKGREADAVVL